MSLKLNHKHEGYTPTYGIKAMSSMGIPIEAPSLSFYQSFYQYSLYGA